MWLIKLVCTLTCVGRFEVLLRLTLQRPHNLIKVSCTDL